MHAPYREYLSLNSYVLDTQVLPVWCVHEIDEPFSYFCRLFAMLKRSRRIPNDFDDAFIVSGEFKEFLKTYADIV